MRIIQIGSRARKVSILAKPTVSPGPPVPDDPLASQRVELLDQLAAAQSDLETVAADLAGNGADASAVQSQLQSLRRLQRHVGGADAATLVNLRRDVAAAVTTSQAVGETAQASAGSAMADAVRNLAEASAASRSQVQSVMAGMRDFDGALRFGSDEDQRTYREREAERRAYIEAQQAKNTPVGNLNAAGAAVGQMADAHAHGAGGPEFDKRWDELVATTEKLRNAAEANGVSTEEFDGRLREDLRAILKSKGLTDAQIDAQFAAHPDPLEAAKAYVHDNVDIAKVQRSAERVDAMSQPASSVAQDDVSKLIATLQSAGVVTTPQKSGSQPEHGVTLTGTISNARSV